MVDQQPTHQALSLRVEVIAIDEFDLRAKRPLAGFLNPRGRLQPVLALRLSDEPGCDPT